MNLFKFKFKFKFEDLDFPGLKIGHGSKYQEKYVTFKNIAELLEKNKLKKPRFQTALDEDKVNEMILSYKKNKDYLIFKNKIVIGVIPDYISASNYFMYVIDGQHRIQMAKEILESDHINDRLIFCYYETDSNKEMKKLFLEINKDSHKNSKYVALDEFNQNIYDQFKKYLYEKKSLFFSQNKKETNKLYSISELMDLLVERKYMEKYSFEELKEDFENKNKIFNRKIDYIEYLNADPNCFYEDEKIPIIEGYICSLKNNNFIDFLVDNENKVIPDHKKFKKMKDPISPTLRIRVWDHWYGKEDTGPCPICNTLIKIGKNGFHCGHKISEANGGETKIDNLRPICASCNLKMGSTNWADYEKLKNNKKNYIKENTI